jgi:hypothetical protein
MSPRPSGTSALAGNDALPSAYSPEGRSQLDPEYAESTPLDAVSSLGARHDNVVDWLREQGATSAKPGIDDEDRPAGVARAAPVITPEFVTLRSFPVSAAHYISPRETPRRTCKWAAGED